MVPKSFSRYSRYSFCSLNYTLSLLPCFNAIPLIIIISIFIALVVQLAKQDSSKVAEEATSANNQTTKR
jgi:hypothetical protein